MTRPIAKVLVANRGEIAARIIRSLDRLGIASVAVHHAVEAKAVHVRMAGEAVALSGDTPVSAHLDAGQIIAAARATGADAIHPGYGFLSENAGFARAVEAAGLVFVGPSADVIALMGDKISARNFAQAQGVPVAPSVLPTGDIDTFVNAAANIGFPLLIKAAAGGGGKGMSIVHRPEDLREAARLAASEAQRYFGDGRVYAELYVENPRHIEVQILGDGKGGAIHLWERECSVQRRFQKIVEEAPAPNLGADLRARICESALRLTKAAKYRNAGTVEYILGADGRFFFLEMNTRLQVEHPVTEEITGLDLVATQIAIAEGRGLPLTQDRVTQTGHAIECRICAEDPDNGFLPETGAILRLDVPRAPWLRFEAALEAGQKVTSDFDPMLAKLVAHGPTRDEAVDRAIAALRGLTMIGVGTNADYLARLLDHPAFRAGALHTGFVAQHGGDLAAPVPDTRTRDRVLIAAALCDRDFRTLVEDVPEPYAAMGGWRN